MLRLYNTLTRSIEKFAPINPPLVTMYSCGPTVYDYQHIGHMRRYVGDDLLVRVLKYNGYNAKHVMNITDVGHLVSDADEGEDKMEKGAKKFGKSVWDIAKMFERQFWDSIDALNVKRPDTVIHATDCIKEQIELIRILERKGFTYQIADGVYFDTSKFPAYFALSRQKPDDLKAGTRIEIVKGKKHSTDFALWKFSYPNGRNFDSAQDETSLKRQMEWESPWGVGFPGWHIECSVMSLQGLFDAFDPSTSLRVDRVNTIDIHTGGIDHIAIHHTNEIAQTEAATGKKFVNFWVHHNFLEVERQKMSKSLENFYTVQDVIDKGFDPMALRYLYLQTHYRQEMNFTWEALNASQIAYHKLLREISNFQSQISNEKKLIGCAEFEQRFLDVVNDDLNMPKALAVIWELIKSDYPASAKLASMKKFDAVLGLELESKSKMQETEIKTPKEIKDLVQEREAFRKAGDWTAADKLRKKIHDLGYEIEDGKDGTKIRLLKT